MSKAFVQRPAPDFQGVAVQDGGFEDVKLSDYQGKWYVPLSLLSRCSLAGMIAPWSARWVDWGTTDATLKRELTRGEETRRVEIDDLRLASAFPRSSSTRDDDWPVNNPGYAGTVRAHSSILLLPLFLRLQARSLLLPYGLQSVPFLPFPSALSSPSQLLNSSSVMLTSLLS
jgi:hypothetical protein